MSIMLRASNTISETQKQNGNWRTFGNRNTSNAGGPRAGVCALGWYNASNGPSNSNANNFGAAS